MKMKLKLILKLKMKLKMKIKMKIKIYTKMKMLLKMKMKMIIEMIFNTVYDRIGIILICVDYIDLSTNAISELLINNDLKRPRNNGKFLVCVIPK